MSNIVHVSTSIKSVKCRYMDADGRQETFNIGVSISLITSDVKSEFPYASEVNLIITQEIQRCMIIVRYIFYFYCVNVYIEIHCARQSNKYNTQGSQKSIREQYTQTSEHGVLL